MNTLLENNLNQFEDIENEVTLASEMCLSFPDLEPGHWSW